ncbi:MAG: hypothetical protein HYV93_10050 [Candidatus Rokubacteria bacterium]|nr:hypothetical protein [Candidatus Rokubacteria bacterium]
MTPFERLSQTLAAVFADTPPARVREVRQVLAVTRILSGEPANVVAADSKLQRRGLEALSAKVAARGLAGIAPEAAALTPENLAKRRLGIAQMLLGVLTERRFEVVIQEVIGEGILQELTPVRTFLEVLVKESPQKFAVRLYIGDY